MTKKFATVDEFNHFAKSKKKIERTFGLKVTSHCKVYEDFESPDEEERKIISIYMEQELFANNVDTFDLSSLPKYTDLKCGLK